MKKILVPTDLSKLSKEAFKTAKEIDWCRNTPVVWLFFG